MKTIKQTLQKARKLVKAGWCQKMFAQNADGDQVDYTNADATKFCMLGAINRSANFIDWKNDDAPQLLEDIQLLEDSKAAMREVLPNKSFAYDNDAPTTKQADVLAWFDKAIENCESK